MQVPRFYFLCKKKKKSPSGAGLKRVGRYVVRSTSCISRALRYEHPMIQRGTSEKARSLLTLGRSCKPSLLRSRFRMQQAAMHGLR